MDTHRTESERSLAVLGPGLVGSYLGAAAGAAIAYPGPSRTIRAQRALLPAGERSWAPRLARFEDHARHHPLLVSCRAHQAPWQQLPPTALAAQNGLGQPREVITCFFALDLIADGIVAAIGPRPRIVLSRPSPAWQPVLGAWGEAGIVVEVADDARPAQWEKAILNATVGPLCLATGMGMGAVWADESLRALTIAATREGVAIAAAAGIAIAPGATDRACDFFGQVGAHRPSVLRDDGELPHVLGHLLTAARKHGVAAPALGSIQERVARRAALAASEARA
jgi:hypothetical protein